MSIPKHLQFSGVRPLGFPNKMRINRFQPQGNLQQFNTNDVIRFIINTKGYWDPYSAYYQFDIDFSEMEDGNVLQLDGSAHSLIRTQIIKTGSTELERIEEYDVLADVLHDLNYSVEKRATVRNQGVGYMQTGYMAKHGDQVQRQSLVGFWVSPANGSQKLGDHCTTNGQGVDLDMVANANPGDPAPNTNLRIGQTNILRGAAYDKPAQSGIVVKDYQMSETVSTAGTNVTGFHFGGQGHHTLVSSLDQPFTERTDRIEKKTIENNYMMSPGLIDQNGVQEIDYSFSFCGTSYEPRFSKTFLQNVIINGKPVKKKITRATFTIPLLSGILGILVPQKSYKLMPMRALRDLVIELQINPYAFFSSGYPASANDTTVLGVPYRRDTWKIARCEIVCEMLEFGRQVDQVVQGQLDSGGIIFHSCSWVKGPTFSFSANDSPQGTFQINQGFDSLRSIAITMNPLDYQLYPYCRKLFRISQNISYFQIKVGLDYYPSLAIQGNGGGCVVDPDNPGSGDNAEFVINLQKAFGKYMDVLGDQYVNVANFAINDRLYDPANKAAWKTGTQITNHDTANGAPHLHEQRCIGKAVYALDLEALSFDPTSISGLNTTQSVPFEIILKSDGQHAFSRKSEMHIFNYYDFLVKFSSNGNSVLGRV